MRVRTGLVLAVLLVGLSSMAVAQPTVQDLLGQIQSLSAKVTALEAKCATMDISAELDKKLNALRDELRAEMAAAGAGGPLDFRVYWADGLRFDTADKSVKLKIGVLLQADMGIFCSDAAYDAIEARRARLYVAGTFGENCGFKVQFDFLRMNIDDYGVGFADAYIEFRKTVLGTIRLGQQKEPFGLDYLTSAGSTTFMERALPVELFAPGRHFGISANKPLLDGRVLLQAGVFANSDEFLNWTHGVGQGYGYTVRASGTPIYADKGRELLHVGVAYSCRVGDDLVSFYSRPESHLGPYVLGTGSRPTEHVCLWGAEVAMVKGPFSVQAEYMGATISGMDDGDYPDYTFSCNWYVQASWFLTGENRQYDKSKGAFTRVNVLNPYCNGKGTGAWELAARYSYADLNGAPVSLGQRVSDVTLGVNWYMNNNLRMMLNYVCVAVEDDPDVHLLQWRFQVDF